MQYSWTLLRSQEAVLWLGNIAAIKFILQLVRAEPEGALELAFTTTAEPPIMPLPGDAGRPQAAQPGDWTLSAPDKMELPLPSSVTNQSRLYGAPIAVLMSWQALKV